MSKSGALKRYFILYTLFGTVTWPIVFVLLLLTGHAISDGVPQLDFNTFAIYSLYSTIASLINFTLGYFLFLHGRRNVL